MEKRKRKILGMKGGSLSTLQVLEVPLKEIRANPQQPRKVFRNEGIEELTASVKEYGVLQPIILLEEEGQYSIIAGERRYRAATMAGLQTIPAVVKKIETEKAALIALVENVQREDLNFIEEARAYKKLMDDFNLTQSEISEKINKQQSTISNKIRILSLPETLQELLVKSNLTERHARALLKLKEDSDRKRVIERVIANKLNVKQTEKLIEEINNKKDLAERKQRRATYISYKIYLNTIRKAFNQVKEMEKNAKIEQEDKGDFLEVRIILPKKDRCFT